MKKINRNLFLLFIFALFSIGGGSFFLYKSVQQKDEKPPDLLTKKNSYFVPLKIFGYSLGNIPYLDVSIADKTIRMELDLGYNGMLTLPSNLIQDITEKRWVEHVQSWGMRGKTYEQDVYEVKKIVIQDMFFSPVHIAEKSLEDMREGVLVGTPVPDEDFFGTIGWKLFNDFNLLIDCKHSLLALCDSIETLKQKGYPVDSFTEGKLLPNSDFIAFEVLTEVGPLCCMLDTGASYNMLNKDLKNDCNNHRILTNFYGNLSLLNPENEDLLVFNPTDTQEISSFKIGGKEFGPLIFSQVKTPINVDVILGMEFFDSTLVYIDFENEKVYFFPYLKRLEEKHYSWSQNHPQKDRKKTLKNEGYFLPFKIYGYSPGNIPFVNVRIEEEIFPVKIDLGYNGTFSLPSEFIEKINEKTLINHIQTQNKRGRTNENNLFEIKQLQIQGTTIHPVRVIEEKPDSMREDVLVGTDNPAENRFGKIGWGSFSDLILLVDCKNSNVALCDSIETLKKQDYPVDSFTAAPIISIQDFIVFEALTDEGHVRCILDTGSTFNLVNKNLENAYKDSQEFSSFKIGGKEFGPLACRSINYPIDIDVILGIEFFNSNLIVIDFKNETVYFTSF